MLSIVLSACLIANPGECRDFTIPLDIDTDVKRCAMVAPPYFAQWAQDHPLWQIRRWKCKPTDLNET